ncbi:MAG TPA: hypothetical protein VIY08_02730 [Candidatus Nitrosocosmicus sp.]
MQTLILVFGGIFWILTYIFIISKGFKDKTYGMPLIALCANVSWEFIYSFIFPHTPPQLFINYLWFGLDVIIVIQFLKYSKNEFLNLTSAKLYSIFILLLVSEFSIILLSSFITGEVKGAYTAFSQNLVMSVLFIIMLFKRKSLRGQSIYIAVFKMLGTGLTSLHYYVYEPITHSSFILPTLYVLIFTFDIVYILLILRFYKKNKMSVLKI